MADVSDLVIRVAADWPTLLFTVVVNAVMVASFIVIDRKYHG